MKQHLGARHHGQSHEFRITPLVADDGRGRDAIDREQGQGVAAGKVLLIAFRQMILGVAVLDAARAVEDDQAVVQLAAAKDRAAEQHVDVGSRRQFADGGQRAADFGRLQRGEIARIPGHCGFGKQDRVGTLRHGRGQ
jgi:hypothetical protein